MPERISPAEGPIKMDHEAMAKRIEVAEKSLATRYDALNQLFTEVELHLRSLRLLRPVWVAYGHQYEQPENASQLPGVTEVTSFELLGVMKDKGKWRLCHAWADGLDGGMDDIQPIIECPIEIRVRAASTVRELHEKIVKEKENFIPEVDAAIEELTYLCSYVL